MVKLIEILFFYTYQFDYNQGYSYFPISFFPPLFASSFRFLSHPKGPRIGNESKGGGKMGKMNIFVIESSNSSVFVFIEIEMRVTKILSVFKSLTKYGASITELVESDALQLAFNLIAIECEPHLLAFKELFVFPPFSYPLFPFPFLSFFPFI